MIIIFQTHAQIVFANISQVKTNSHGQSQLTWEETIHDYRHKDAWCIKDYFCKSLP